MAEIPKTIGRYDIIELVGRGGMGVLYRARDPMLERDVALKMMLVDFTLDQGARERFQREAKAVARLQHRNVVTIHELGEADGAPYIVMEFLSGQDLESRLVGAKALTLVEKLDVVIQLCEGLGYAHEQGIVHRDIKPSNVRVLEDGTVKILDFGIAKFAVSSVTQSGAIMGTASYMSPEQIMGKPVDGRADLFSAGVLLHEILVGHKPFAGDSPTAAVYQIMHVEPPPVRSVMPDLPEALDEIVLRALKKDPDERYSRASEMASDLQMVKMMLDLPMNSVEGSPAASGSAPSMSSAGTGKLHATMIGMKPASGKAATAVLKTPMRASAEDALSDAAPRAADGNNSGFRLIAAAVIGVGLLIVGAMWLFNHGTAPAPVTTTAAAPAPAAPSTSAAGIPGGGAAGRSQSGSGSGNPKTADATPPSKSGAKGAAPSAPASAAAPSELLAVSSSPNGARITLNGVDTGKVTPQALQLSAKGSNTIQLALHGYQPLSATISDSDIRSGSREFTLVRTVGPVQLTVSGSYPFDLMQGEKVLSAGQTKHEVTVEPNGGPVSARSKDYLLNMSIAVDFQKSQMEATVPAPGKLAVFSAVETCTVSVDGQDLGPVPVPNKSIASGKHSVTLKCPDGRTETQSATVPPNDKFQVTFGKPKSEKQE